MKTMFFRYKRFAISWFMFFVLLLGTIGYYIARSLGNQYGEDKKKIEDIYLVILLSSFIGARIFYVVTHFNSFKGNLLGILNLSHYNLSLIGGVITGLLLIFIISKKEKISIEKMLMIFLPSFYFSMSVGIWMINFDRLLKAPAALRNNSGILLLMSLIFLMALILELSLLKNEKYKKFRIFILIIVMFLYYII